MSKTLGLKMAPADGQNGHAVNGNGNGQGVNEYDGVKHESKVNGHGVDGQGLHTTIDINEPPHAMRKSMRAAEITVKFEDVKYKVVLKNSEGKWYNPFKSLKHTDKEILHGITGSVLPGEVLAMMGPSGSGKTTFLSVLGGRVGAMNNVTGSVTYNDLPYSKALKRKLGFVTQDDVFFPHLTVRETLMYAALLRLPKELSRAEKIARAEDTIVDLGLEKCRNTIIGGPFLRGVSGGERKRVSIGHEILIDPSMLLLDEPTSGLDSTTALRIVQLLQKIAQTGRTVVTTIHQPSSRLFHSFDKLLLLSEGHNIYFGKAADAMEYYERVGFAPMFASNPADFLLDLASGTTGGIRVPQELQDSEKWQNKPQMEQQADVREYLVTAANESLLVTTRRDLAALPAATDAQKHSITEKRVWNATWFQQFGILWTRGLKERRHEVFSWLRIWQVLAISLIVGCLWYNSNHNNFQNATDQIGFLFFCSIFWGFFPLISAIFTFPQERSMLAKERASDMYQLSAYFLSRTLSDIPMEWALPIAYLAISYFMANLKVNAGIFFLTLLGIFLNISSAQGCGFLIGAVVMDVKKATTLASVILLTFMLCGGYYLQHIPAWIGWVKYIAFTYYSYRLIIKTQYSKSDTYGCGTNNDQRCLIGGPNGPLKGIELGGGWTEGWALIVMVVGYRLLAYMALRRMKTGG